MGSSPIAGSIKQGKLLFSLFFYCLSDTITLLTYQDHKYKRGYYEKKKKTTKKTNKKTNKDDKEKLDNTNNLSASIHSTIGNSI